MSSLNLHTIYNGFKEIMLYFLYQQFIGDLLSYYTFHFLSKGTLTKHVFSVQMKIFFYLKLKSCFPNYQIAVFSGIVRL